MELLRLSVAARRVGLHSDTLRVWADAGKVSVVWVGRERRVSAQALAELIEGESPEAACGNCVRGWTGCCGERAESSSRMCG
jgi:excisionase family DNA binding protein